MNQNDLTSVPMSVFIGGVAAPVAYRGRSQFPGLDQIVVTVPTNVPLGCAVSVVAVSGTVVSNSVTLPIAEGGGACIDSLSPVTASQLQSLASKDIISYGVVYVLTTPSAQPAGIIGDAGAFFYQYQGFQLAAQLATMPSLGSCVLNSLAIPQIYGSAPIDPALYITLYGPGLSAGGVQLPYSTPVGGYTGSAWPSTLAQGGSYVFYGVAAGTFLPNTPVKLPANPAVFTAASQSTGLTVAWSGGDPDSYVQISGTGYGGSSFLCNAPVSAGQFTVPAWVASALGRPLTPGGVQAADITYPQAYSVEGLDISFGYGAAISSVTFRYCRTNRLSHVIHLPVGGILVQKLKIPVLLVSAVLLAPAADRSFGTWSEYLGGADSSQYSSLKQINKSNVKQLEIAWQYPTGPGTYTFDPLIVDGVMYVLAQSNSVVALDAATGKEQWVHPNMGAVGQRGLNYWESKDRSDRRLFYINAGFLTAIDARTGKTIMGFGDNGRTDLRNGLDRDPGRALQTSNPGRIFENIIITPLPAGNASYDSTPADIHAYDVITGKLVWTFHVVPHPGEFGYATWPPDAWKTVGGVHNWNEMTVDEKRGIAYFPLGTARYDFYGANRKGNNLFGNSLLALDARTGKRLWHFQIVHHDLWDYDLTGAPKLLTVKHDGKSVDVVAQPTKFGFLYVFNRVTGEPLWPIEERPVPQSDVPGEWSSPTQPFPTKPPAFARQSFTEKDINPFATEAEQAAIRELLKNSRNEGLFTPPSLRGSISAPGHNGGANWGMTAVDPTKGYLYVISKEHPTLDKLALPGQGRGGRGAKGAPAAPAPVEPPAPVDDSFTRYNSPVNFITQSGGLSAMGPPWSNLTAFDLNTGTIRWQVPNGGVLELEKEGHSDTGARDPRGGPVVTAGGLIFAATASDHKVRAYDADNGKVLWEYELPTGSDGIPAVYEVGGREYVVFCVAGGDGLNLGGRRPSQSAPPPSAYVAFALPKK